MSTSADRLRACGWTLAGAVIRPRLLWRPPVGAVIARTRCTLERVARAGVLWQAVEIWTRPAHRPRRR